MVYGFQRSPKGLFVPSPGGLPGFQRQGLDQRKKSTDLAPAFGPGSVGPQWSGGGGKFNVVVNAAVSGAVANAFMYLPKAIKPLSGAWYWEVQVYGSGSWALIGIADNILNPGFYMGYSSINYGWYNSGPAAWAKSPATGGDLTGFAAMVAGDTLGVLYNSNTATLSFLLNNVYSGTSDTTGIASNPMYPTVAIQIGAVTSFDVRFGAGNTKYSLPNGFKHYGT